APGSRATFRRRWAARRSNRGRPARRPSPRAAAGGTTCIPSNARRRLEAEKNYPNGWARKSTALSHVESIAMNLLYSYLRRYWRLVVLALVLATINQVFSLLDPLILRHVIDEY